MVPLTPGGVKKAPMTAVDARSLHRSRRRRRRAPRLASCLSRTGLGSREFPAPTTRRWAGIWHPPRAVLIPPVQDLAADARRRPYVFTMASYSAHCITCMNHGGNLSFAMSEASFSRLFTAASPDNGAKAPVHILRCPFRRPKGHGAALQSSLLRILSTFGCCSSSGWCDMCLAGYQ